MQLGLRHCSAACAQHTCPRAIVPTMTTVLAQLAAWIGKGAISTWPAATHSLRILLSLLVALQTTEGYSFSSYKGKWYCQIPPKFHLQQFSPHYSFNMYHDVLGYSAVQPTTTPRQPPKFCMKYSYPSL